MCARRGADKKKKALQDKNVDRKTAKELKKEPENEYFMYWKWYIFLIYVFELWRERLYSQSLRTSFSRYFKIIIYQNQ